MLRRLALIACVLAIAVSSVVAQAPPPPGPPPMMPGLMIPLPDGMMPPPPEDGPEALDAFLGEAFVLIAGDDGVMTLEELKELMRSCGPPEGDGSMPCGEEEEEGAEIPRADCDSCTGNLIERTICNDSAYHWQAISMPAGRNAGCLNVEAKSPSPVIFTIYAEDDPTNILFDSDRDGLHNINTVMGTLTHTSDTVYHVELDMSRSAPDAWAKVTCVDYAP